MYVTYGDVRGMGPLRETREQAERDLARDRAACGGSNGGYSDREVYEVDEDGFLIGEDGGPVWPSHGRSAGAVRA